MKTFRNLLILFFTINFYATDLNYKSSFFNKDSILNFEFEINKFKDSLNRSEEKNRLLKSYTFCFKPRYGYVPILIAKKTQINYSILKIAIPYNIHIIPIS